jgi:two-component system NarL family response regulator
VPPALIERLGKDQTGRPKKEKTMAPIKVAIADANIFLREGLKRVFSAESDLVVVGEAANDIEVADIVQRTRPSVLLLDLEIPTRKAVPVLLELEKKNLPIKVLIFSLYPDRQSILETAKAGASGYALKDTPPSTLIQAVRKIHAGEIWVDRQLNYADTFLEAARQKAGHDVAGENGIGSVLSKRETEILTLVARGLTNKEIGKTLFISVPTVKIHLNHVFFKLGVTNRTQATLRLVLADENNSAGKVGVADGKYGGVSRLDKFMSVESGSPRRDPPFRSGWHRGRARAHT